MILCIHNITYLALLPVGSILFAIWLIIKTDRAGNKDLKKREEAIKDYGKAQ